MAPLSFFSILVLATIIAAASVIDIAAYSSSSIIRRDVCIIGGGSSGTYSAIRLHDSGKTVAVVESRDRMGGHTNTYTDPVTNGTIDIGVIVFHNLTVVKDYFARFEIPLRSIPTPTYNPLENLSYVDYRTGQSVPEAGSQDPSAGLAAYAAQLAKYPYLEAGFDLPQPVPADLLLPFGDIVKKYALQGSIPSVFNYGQGIGDLLALPTLYAFKLVGLSNLLDRGANAGTTRNEKEQNTNFSHLFKMSDSSIFFFLIHFRFFHNIFIIVIHYSI